MASQQHTTTIESLPSDVLSDILIRLFAKQLGQMRCVSKSWYALLSRKSFVKSHLDRSIHNNDKILLFFHLHETISANSTRISTYSTRISAHPSRSPHLELHDFIKLPVNLQSEGIDVIGSVNGLICLIYRSGHNSSVLNIWNPSLSAVLTLPPYSKPSSFHINKHEFRFGYDPKTDDYKVLRLATSFPGHYPHVKERLQVELYSMRKGSWAFITPMIPPNIKTFIDHYRVCVDGHDGHLHWLCGLDDRVIILAFDLTDETFREIPLPDEYKGDHNDTHILGVLRGKFFVMSYDDDFCECKVWWMEEYGVPESWVKRCLFDCRPFPSGFTSYRKLLLDVGVEKPVVFYDPVTDEEEYFEITNLFEVVNYVDSLVWVSPS